MPVEMHSDVNPRGRAEEDEAAVHYEAVPIDEDATAAVRARSSKLTDIRVTHRDIEMHGATPGCPACRHIQDNTQCLVKWDARRCVGSESGDLLKSMRTLVTEWREPNSERR